MNLTDIIEAFKYKFKKQKHVEYKIFNLDQKESLAWSGIVVHHSATEDSDKYRNIGAIRRFHTSYRIDGEIVTKEEFERREAAHQGTSFLEPWKDVAYHFLVERRGEKIVWEYGRPLNEFGAHAGHKKSNIFNKTHIGFCIVGNFDKESIDKEMLDFCVNACKEICAHFNIDKTNVIGHREVFTALGVPVEKQCPGSTFSMDDFRNRL